MRVYLAASVLFVLLVLGGSACRRTDIRTIKIDVPQMKGEVCAHIVGQAVVSLKGVLPERTFLDIGERTITVTYDSIRTAIKNIEFAIADAGFQANDVPANEEQQALLPEECRPEN